MEVITTDSFTFEVPSSGENFVEGRRFVWHDDRHELIISVTTGTADVVVAALESNARATIEETLVSEQLQVVGRVTNDPSAAVPCFFVTASPSDRSCLFTQAVLRTPAAVMFATFESFTFDAEHIKSWSAFVRSVRTTPPN